MREKRGDNLLKASIQPIYKGGDSVAKIKIVCHCCDGKGKISEKEYPSRKEIMTICPECNGEGWVWTEK